jgi:hypothetical protein
VMHGTMNVKFIVYCSNTHNYRHDIKEKQGIRKHIILRKNAGIFTVN